MNKLLFGMSVIITVLALPSSTYADNGEKPECLDGYVWEQMHWNFGKCCRREPDYVDCYEPKPPTCLEGNIYDLHEFTRRSEQLFSINCQGGANNCTERMQVETTNWYECTSGELRFKCEVSTLRATKCLPTTRNCSNCPSRSEIRWYPDYNRSVINTCDSEDKSGSSMPSNNKIVDQHQHFEALLESFETDAKEMAQLLQEFNSGQAIMECSTQIVDPTTMPLEIQ